MATDMNSILVDRPGSGGVNAPSPYPPFETGPVDIIFSSPLDPSLMCPICNQALRSPMRLPCGHRFCQACLPLEGSTATCLVCGKSGQAVVDKAVHRQIQSLAVFCSFKHNDCAWSGSLKDLADHVKTCTHRDIVCPKGCGGVYQKANEAEHFASDCGKREATCTHCEKAVPAKGLEMHHKVCPKLPIACPNNCGVEGMLREEMPSHLPSCPNAGNACPFAEWGCTFGGGREVLQKHIKEEPIRHLTYLCDGVIELKAMLAFMQLNGEKMRTTISSLETKSSSLEKMYGAQCVWRIDNVHQRMNEAKSGSRTIVYSPYFMSSRHGYKMMLSACLHGDGQAAGQYFSLYVNILRGEYDSLLEWPFLHKITLTLMDQNTVEAERRVIDYVIRPVGGRENKHFLDRPTSERNAAFGAQRFCLLDTLVGYITDDTIFVKCAVDTEHMPIL